MSNPLPTAFVSHQVPGRVRLRVPTMRHQEDYFARLREQLASIPGLHRLTTNTRTASVLIEYLGDVPALDQLGAQHQLFQNFVFEAGEFYRLLIHFHLLRSWIECNRAATQNRLRPAA